MRGGQRATGSGSYGPERTRRSTTGRWTSLPHCATGTGQGWRAIRSARIRSALLGALPASLSHPGRRQGRPRSSWSGRALESLGEVGNQVVRVLDTDGVADEAVLDSDLKTLLARQLVEAHDGRLLDEALDAAERDREIGDPAGVHDPRGGVEVAPHLE